MITIACVLRSGGDYDADDVRRLRDGVAAHCTVPHRFICLSDVDVPCERIPLRSRWPGWWSKIELCAPWVRGDLFYADLDTMFVGDIGDLVTFGRLGIMRDVYRKDGLQSSLMFIPQESKAEIWGTFLARSGRIMRECVAGGDQAFLERFWLKRAARFQDHLPGQIVSYKADVQRLGHVPAEARAVVFHGRPRPREIGWKLPA